MSYCVPTRTKCVLLVQQGILRRNLGGARAKVVIDDNEQKGIFAVHEKREEMEISKGKLIGMRSQVFLSLESSFCHSSRYTKQVRVCVHHHTFQNVA
jgi:hypothetical protein